MLNKIVYLAGFMTTGKSAIGPILSNTLGWNFYDLDDVIETKYNYSIKKLFNEKGEVEFRAMENKVLAELNPERNAIIALGGGTMMNQENISLMKKRGLIILFESSENEIYHRMKHKMDRPFALDDKGYMLGEKELKIKIKELLKSRKKYYDQADIKIKTSNELVGKIVDKLSKIIINRDF